MLRNEWHEVSDERLVELSQQGNLSAFEEIVRRYKDKIFNTVFRIVGRREDAHEVALDVFVKAYHHLETFRGDARIYTWLYRIAINLAKNRLRDGSRMGRNLGVSLESMKEDPSTLASSGLQSANSPRNRAEVRELEEMLQCCLNELPDELRTVFVLKVFEDLSYEEISQIMNCPLGTVKSRLNQARSVLRRRLTELSIL
ncbi:MAG TPA: sigma-70 family RNA polymerase sigma factor [Candidatus Hydrogenedentes bacterium]|nr:sigma-70 family RNA polymerase sigma factor [Candidatus Hydrogenedentota bacterium]HOL75703.1 sigma-70 family RNA polymerase sigma factor [Candidatus Hydrogenedentota bacterium]HPO84304.1 sigma-70 family RNA polymerase sigma factor [Candidatus Hydrogenedentota bacterium]